MAEHLVKYFFMFLFLTLKHGMSQTTGIEYYNLFSAIDYTSMQNEENYVHKHCSMQASIGFGNDFSQLKFRTPLCENTLVAVMFNLSVEIRFDENGNKSLTCENLSPDNYRVYHLWHKQDRCIYRPQDSNGTITYDMNNTLHQAHCEMKFENVTEDLTTRLYNINYSETSGHVATDNDAAFLAHIAKYGDYKLIDGKIFATDYDSFYVNGTRTTVTYNCTDTSNNQTSTTTENNNVANLVRVDRYWILFVLLTYLFKRFML